MNINKLVMKNKIDFDNMEIGYGYASKTGGADSTCSANCYDGGGDDGCDNTCDNESTGYDCDL